MKCEACDDGHNCNLDGRHISCSHCGRSGPDATKGELTVAVYVDSQHLWYASRAFAEGQGYRNGKLDYEALLGTVLSNLRLRNPDKVIRFIHQRIYVTTQSRALGFTRALDNFGYDIREHIMRSRDDSFDWDTQIVVDIFNDKASAPADVVVLVSGDGDFIPLAQTFPDMITFGFPSSTSPKLPNVTYLDTSVIYA